jgi:signal transduction histidine kinase
MRVRLWVRLLVSYLAIVAVGTAVTYVTMRLLAPRLFDERVHQPGSGQGMGIAPGQGQGPSLRAAFRSALNTALLVALATSAVAGAAIALFISKRIARPVNAVRFATRSVAKGNYDVHVPEGSVPELAGLAADVNTLATELAGTESRRTRLLGDVAHEMRTPLTALDGYVEGLIDGVFRPEPATLAAMVTEVQRLHRLADDLATLSRAEERRLDLRLADIDLAALVRTEAARLRSQFEDADLMLTVNSDERICVHADAGRIGQLLTNLLGNALAATPPGGGVTITTARRGQHAMVTVSDTGVGLAAADLDRIFERFYRVATHARHGSGSGVGLTIARSIARAHGGDLTAHSPGVGRGAQFTLTLPVLSTHNALPPQTPTR